MREGTGLGNWTLFCPVYPMPLDLGMCGGFPMSATGMEQVSIFIAYSPNRLWLQMVKSENAVVFLSVDSKLTDIDTMVLPRLL